MLNNSLRGYHIFFSIIVLSLLICQTPISASKLVASKYGAGFNAIDATAALQGAINSGADTVIVPNMGTDWIVKPIFCKSNQTIIFEKGVVVTAKKGEFHGSNDCLFRMGGKTGPNNAFVAANNVTLIGYGATFRMQKADYMNPALYVQAQWRNCIQVSSNDITIKGLTLKDSGGDGIMAYYANNLLVKDVICDNNYRQGISPVHVINCKLENCVLINTSGFPSGPNAGVDWEPDYNWMNETGQMINCYVENNTGGGVLFAFSALDNTSPAVDIQLKHCFITSGGRGAIALTGKNNGIPPGTVSVEDCIIESPTSWFSALNCRGKSANSYSSKFTDCLFQNCNPAIGVLPYSSETTTIVGGMEFDNCIINEPDNQPTIVRGSGISIANITGNITFNGPYGLQSNLGTGTNVTLSVATNSPTKPPIVTSVIPAKGSPAHVTDFTAGDVINISAVAYDPDIATANGAGISRVDFALWRGDGVVASISDVSAPYDWSLVTTTQYERGIYLIRITAYSQDGSYTVAVVPVNLFEPTLITGRVDLKTESNKKLNVKTFPNPFIERVTFEYSLPDTGETNLKIYDISGIKVKIYDFGLQSKGLNNKNVDLKGLADGIYYYRLTCGKAVQNGKIIKV